MHCYGRGSITNFFGSIALNVSTTFDAFGLFYFMKLIPLSRASKWHPNPKHAGKYFAQVDDEDFERVNKIPWSIHHENRDCKYASWMCKGKTIFLHRFIMGADDTNVYIDHKDHNGLNCQKYNMRTCTVNENNRNRFNKRNSKSKYKGICKQKNYPHWNARIMIDGKRTFIGAFPDEISAAKAYDKKALELFGEFAYLNFP